jgi:hypothetical protein
MGKSENSAQQGIHGDQDPKKSCTDRFREYQSIAKTGQHKQSGSYKERSSRGALKKSIANMPSSDRSDFGKIKTPQRVQVPRRKRDEKKSGK